MNNNKTQIDTIEASLNIAWFRLCAFITLFLLISTTKALAASVTLDVTWPSFPDENSVSIETTGGTTVAGPYSTNSTSGTFGPVTLSDNTTYVLRMVDSFGDGWNGAANVAVNVDGVTVLNDSGPTVSTKTTSFSTNTTNPPVTRIINSSGGQCSFDSANGGLVTYVGANGQFQVERCSATGNNSNTRQYFLTSLTPPATNLFNSLILKVGNTSIGANGSGWFNIDQGWSSVSSSGGSSLGDGSTEHVMSAVVGGLTYTVTQTINYIFPNDFYTVSLDVAVPSGNTQNIKLYSWTDIMLDGDDNGSCSRQSIFPEHILADNTATTLYSGYRQRSVTNHWDRYWCGLYSDGPETYVDSVSGDLPNTLTTSNHDVGAAVQWNIGTVSNTTYRAEYDYMFSVNEPTLTKRYGPDDGDTDHTINAGETTQLTFTITNRPGQPAQGSINFTETLPSNVSIVGTPTASQCGGTVSTGTSGGRDTVTLTTGAMVGGTQTCSIVVDVTSSTVGVYDDPASNVTALNNLKNLAQAELTVDASAGPVTPISPVAGVCTLPSADRFVRADWPGLVEGTNYPFTTDVAGYTNAMSYTLLSGTFDGGPLEFTSTRAFTSSAGPVQNEELQYFEYGLDTLSGVDGAVQFDFTTPLDATAGIFLSDLDAYEKIEFTFFDASGTQLSTTNWTGEYVQVAGGPVPNNTGTSIVFEETAGSNLSSPTYLLIPDPAQAVARMVITQNDKGGGTYELAVVHGICDPDYSDAPADGAAAPAGGTTAYGEATHTVTAGIQLGATITGENSAAFNADNTSDDGVVMPTLTAGDTADVTIAAGDITATSTGTVNLYGWVDFDGDGSFGTNEFATTTVTNGTADGSLIFSGYGSTMAAGTTYARFRLTSDTLTSADAATAASDGEVEDYAITILSLNISGNVYEDSNGSDTFDSGTDPTLPNIQVSLYDDKGTADTSDDTLISSTDSAADGSYQFTITDNSLTYRVAVDTTDADLPTTLALGAPNNVQGIDVSGGSATVDFGFETAYVPNLPAQMCRPTVAVFDVQYTITETSNTASQFYAMGWSDSRLGYPVRGGTPSVESTLAAETDKPAELHSETVAAGELPKLLNAEAMVFVHRYEGTAGASVTLPIVDEGAGENTVVVVTDSSGNVLLRDPASSALPGLPVDSNNRNVTFTVPGDGVAFVRVYMTDPTGFYYGVHPNICQEYGDAPAPYATAIADNGPSHADSSSVYLGSGVSEEGRPYGGDGVDNSGDATDDSQENGVFIDSGLTSTLQGVSFKPEDSSTLHIPVTGSGNLYAWIDFDGDGTFGNNANERIASGISGSDETLTVNVNTPLSASLGNTYARFRFSSDAAAATPTGAASDGEVEDYAITVQAQPAAPTALPGCPLNRTLIDWRNSTPTFAAVTSAGSQTISYGGRTFALTYADGATGGTPKISAYTEGSDYQVLYLEGSGLPQGDDSYSIEIDLDGNVDALGFTIDDFDYGSGEANAREGATVIGYLGSTPVTPSAVPQDNTFLQTVLQTDGSTYVYTTSTTNQNYLPSDPSSALGAVDFYFTQPVDRVVITRGFAPNQDGSTGGGIDLRNLMTCADYTDAPTATLGGANHVTVSDIYLGAGATSDAGDYNNADAAGDIDDGVTIPTLIQGATATVTALVSGTGGYLQGWVDWNGDGVFDNTSGSNEIVAVDLQDNANDGSANNTDTDATTGTIAFSVIPPVDATTNQTFARFRWSTTAGLDATTAASDGEVEDYAVDVDSNTGTPWVPPVCEVIPPGNPTAALTAAQVGFDIAPVANGFVLNSISISGEPSPFSHLVTPDSVDYSFANPLATSQYIMDQGALTSINITSGAALFRSALLEANTDRDLRHYLSLDNTINASDYVDFNYNTPITAAGNRYVLATERNGNNRIGLQALDINGNVIGGTVEAIPGSTYIDTGVEADAGQNANVTIYPLTALAPSGTPIYSIRYIQTVPTPLNLGRTDGGDGKVFVLVDPVSVCISPDMDYGDAPVSGTAPDGSSTNAYGEASHTIVSGSYLGGADPDADSANQPTASADGDDNDGTNDEDGISISGLTQGSSATITATVAGAGGYLQGWIDWNGDGSFDNTAGSNEIVAVDLQDNANGGSANNTDTDASAGTIAFSVIPPVGATTNQTFARFRWSTIAGLDATTAASDGEVEDYALTILAGQALSGIVFEDINYGGGAGRDQATSSGAGVNGATVELYDNTGALHASTTTANDGSNDGAYTFSGIIAGDYFVRVVSDSVSSTRTGSDGFELGVQTFRTDGTTAVTGEVGGRAPALVDAGAHDSGSPSTLNTTTFVFSGGTLDTLQAQSITPVTVTSSDNTGIDFGFNFDTIVNTNDSGQGSLRQFIVNSNLLTDIPNQGINAGQETSIFMVPDGSAYAGTESHTTLDLTTAGVVVIKPSTVLPIITDDAVSVDGSTQSGASCGGIRDANGAITDRSILVALDGTNAGTGATADGLTIGSANAVTVKGLSIGNFDSDGLRADNSTNFTATCNHIGLAANGIALAGNNHKGIVLNGVTSADIGDATVSGMNVVGANTNDGIWMEGTIDDVIIDMNYVGIAADGNTSVGNGRGYVGSGISFAGYTGNIVSDGEIIRNNVISGNGFELGGFYGTTNNVLIENNLLGTDATGLLDRTDQWYLIIAEDNEGWIIRNNVIAGSDQGSGIELYSMSNMTIQGNKIGVGIDGTTAIGNGFWGIRIDGGAGHVIGGLGAGEGNIVANNSQDYVNGYSGILIQSGAAATISGNTIHSNLASGVQVSSSTSLVTISRNQIFNNTGLGIDLKGNEVTNNDANDVDTGANSLLNFPQFKQSILVGSNLIISGCAPAGATIELFEADVSPTSVSGVAAGANQFGETQDYGEGEVFLTSWVMPASGTACAMSTDADGNNPSGMLAFSQTFALTSLPAGTNLVLNDKLTATATVSGTGTSEFSAVAMVAGQDYGDAPDNYLTRLAVDGARHDVVNDVYLGSVKPDVDSDGQPGIAANGDGVDEDGISSLPVLNAHDRTYAVTVKATNATSSAATLMGWIDFDGSGTFDADEVAMRTIAAGTSAANIELKWSAIPIDITAGDTYLRVRLTTDSLSNTEPGGAKRDGEVEDYALSITTKGVSVSGRVYNDTDVDGVNDSTEIGVSGLPVVLFDGATCQSVRTDAEGNYRFDNVEAGSYQVYEASRETTPVPANCGIANARDPKDYRSTTVNVSASFAVSNTDITGIDFGDVKEPSFKPDNVATVLPGNVVFYAHEFVPLSTGSVTFTSANSTPATSGWSQVLYQDTDCNGSLDGNDGGSVIGADLPTTEGTPVCLINKVYAPSNVTTGEDYSNVISADFTFGGPANTTAGTIQLTVTDLTKAAANDAGGSSRLELKKTVQTYRGAPLAAVSAESETQNQALPGDVLRYRIYYSNTGDAPLSDLVINDVVPEFTILNGAPVCETPLPASLTSCTPGVSGDAVEWVFPATDKLQGGGAGVVSYEVIIE